MALPKKGLRKITVHHFRYAWSATGNDGYINLTIAPLDNEGQLLTANFDYHHQVIKHADKEIQQQLVITPYIVRQVIEYALGKGWKPEEKAAQMNLMGMDNKIDLRLNA